MTDYMTEFFVHNKSKGHPARQIEIDDSYFMKYVLVDFSEYWKRQDFIRKMKDKLNQEIEKEFFRNVYGI